MAVVSAPHSSQHSSQQSSPKQDQVWLVTLDPTQEVEIQKTRPCLVISPDEMNQHLRTVIIAPMTTVTRRTPRA
jgi:mRNA interferase MazF